MSTKIYNAYWYTGDFQKLHRLLFKLRQERLEVHRPCCPSDRELYELWVKRDNQAERELEESAVVYAPPGGHGGFLVQFFVGDRDFDQRLRRIRSLPDYHYQNSTDQPDDLSKREWSLRRRIWDTVLKHDDVPANAGFTYRLCSLEFLAMRALRRLDEARKKAES